jgi:hypothetical protein
MLELKIGQSRVIAGVDLHKYLAKVDWKTFLNRSATAKKKLTKLADDLMAGKGRQALVDFRKDWTKLMWDTASRDTAADVYTKMAEAYNLEEEAAELWD